MRRPAALALALLGSLSACSAPPAAETTPASPQSQPSKPLPLDAPTMPVPSASFDASAFDAIVKKAVNGRFVDYDKVAADEAALKAFVDAVAAAKPNALGGKNDQLAFYANAYNANVLLAVLNAKRPKSVLDVKGFFDGQKVTVAGESLTLNELEEKKLRSAGDPRVHFAVNCASYDCPPLQAAAFTGATFEANLESLTRDFLQRQDEVAFDAAKKEVRVVQIFEWYQKDWGDEAKVRAFIARYVGGDVAAAVSDPKNKLSYRPYDWRNNGGKY